MSKHKFQIGLLAVVFLVLLRVSIGWHFLYEGLHKFNPRHEFSAESFLAVAKGPTAELFYMLLPDLDGVGRLAVAEIEEDGKKFLTFPVYEDAWLRFRAQFEKQFAPDEDQIEEMDAVHLQFLQSLRSGAADVSQAIEQYKGGLERHRAEVASGTNNAAHQQARNWDGMMKLRTETKQWLSELNGMSVGLQNGFWRILSSEQQAIGKNPAIVTRPEKTWVPNPIIPKQLDAMNMGVTIALTAIGACLMLGLCTRLACLGGAAFLASVVLSQFPLANIYPQMPSMIGHFMFVSKDFIEMLALLALMAMPSGRWGGLDFFLWNFGGKCVCKKYGCCADEESKTGDA